LLTFPAGTIEPDPAVRAAAPLVGWSNSPELLVRLVPETVVLPVAVSGVISRRSQRHRIAKCFADRKEREWAAATLQVLSRRLRDTQTRVLIGEPISSRQMSQRSAVHWAMESLLGRVTGRNGKDFAASKQTHNELAMSMSGPLLTHRDTTVDVRAAVDRGEDLGLHGAPL
jgi:hypothetical protein